MILNQLGIFGCKERGLTHLPCALEVPPHWSEFQPILLVSCPTLPVSTIKPNDERRTVSCF